MRDPPNPKHLKQLAEQEPHRGEYKTCQIIQNILLCRQENCTFLHTSVILVFSEPKVYFVLGLRKKSALFCRSQCWPLPFSALNPTGLPPESLFGDGMSSVEKKEDVVFVLLLEVWQERKGKEVLLSPCCMSKHSPLMAFIGVAEMQIWSLTIGQTENKNYLYVLIAFICVFVHLYLYICICICVF